MTSTARKRRGAETQAAVARWYREHGWPFATDAGSGRAGVDILNMAGLCPEAKARREFNPTEWARQASANANKSGGVAYVVLRPDGVGLTRVGDWLVIRRLEDDTELLRLAGYGDPL